MPVEAVEFILDQKPPGNLYNAYNWGGYLLWAAPEYPVFIDGRTDLYDGAVIDDWVHVVMGRDGWGSILDDYAVNLVLIENGSTLHRLLDVEVGWHLIYQDELAVVFARILQ